MSTILTPGVWGFTSGVSTPIANTTLTSQNCRIIYQAKGNYTSYVPGSGFNSLTNFVNGDSYTIQVLQTVDLTAYAQTGGGGSGSTLPFTLA